VRARPPSNRDAEDRGGTLITERPRTEPSVPNSGTRCLTPKRCALRGAGAFHQSGISIPGSCSRKEWRIGLRLSPSLPRRHLRLAGTLSTHAHHSRVVCRVRLRLSYERLRSHSRLVPTAWCVCRHEQSQFPHAACWPEHDENNTNLTISRRFPIFRRNIKQIAAIHAQRWSGGVILCQVGFDWRHAKMRESRTYDDTLCGDDCCGSLGQ